MKLEVYDSTQYDTWEDAEASGAVYGAYLPDSCHGLPLDDLKHLVLSIIRITETCVRFDSSIRVRIGWEEIKARVEL